MKDILSVVAGLLAIFAIIPYVIDIVKGKTKPNIVSWFTWSLLLAIITAASFAAHEPRTAFLSLGDFIGTAATLLLGIKYGIAKFSWFDGLCQGGAAVVLVLWLVFNSPVVAILATLGIDMIAAIPTLKHAWESPSEETWQTYFVIIIASTLTLFALSSYSVASLAFPMYLIIANFGIVGTIVFKRRSESA